MKKYSFAVEGLYGNLSAQEVAEELERIQDIYGELKPEFVIEASKDKDAILHNCFEWNIQRAAEAYRREQARKLINNIRVEIVRENVSCRIRAFVNVRQQKDKPRSIIPVEEAVLNKTAYNDLLEQAQRDMENFVEIYSQLEELNSVKAEMLRTLSELK